MILVAFCHRIKTLKMLFLSTKLTWDLTQEVCVSLFPASAFIVFWGAKSAFNPAFRCSREEGQSLDRNLITLQFRFRYFGVNGFFVRRSIFLVSLSSTRCVKTKFFFLTKPNPLFLINLLSQTKQIVLLFFVF